MSHFASSMPPEKIRNTQLSMLGMAFCVAVTWPQSFVADNALLYFLTAAERNLKRNAALYAAYGFA